MKRLVILAAGLMGSVGLSAQVAVTDGEGALAKLGSAPDSSVDTVVRSAELYGLDLRTERAPRARPLNSGTAAVLEVVFSNLGVGVNAPIYDTDGVTKLAGSEFKAALAYDAAPLGGVPLTPAPPSADFVGNGYFFGGNRTISGFNSGDKVTLWVLAWDTRSGATYDTALVRGISKAFELTVPALPPVGFPSNPPLPLRGLESFQLVPEPRGYALVFGLGLLSLGICRRLRTRHLERTLGR
jgi:hypothetical protein